MSWEKLGGLMIRNKPTSRQLRQYAAAKTTRLTGDWLPVDGSINNILSTSLTTVRARVRQLVRDFPYFKRAVDLVVDYTVGAGIHFQSRVKNTDGSGLDSRAITAIEDVFNFWADEADVAGKLHFYELMSLAKRQDMESGEFLLVKTNPRKKNPYLPYALQMFEADWLTDIATNPKKGNQISQGIEYDRASGLVAAYHFTDPDSWGKTIRIPAARVIHGFETLRPGQLRGISPLVTAVLLAHDLSEYMDAEIDNAKLAAKWLAIIETPDMGGLQAGLGTDTAGRKIEELENSIIEYLRPGEKINLASNPRPGSNFPPFVKLLLSMLAVVGKVPYELLSGDYAGLNYSAGKLIRNDFKQQLKPLVGRHIHQFCQPAAVPVIETAVLAGKLRLPDFFNRPDHYLKIEWQPPGLESIDPGRETKSTINQIKSLLRSPQEVTRARGRDYEEVLREIKAAKDLAESYGLTMEEVSTALANNPAAVDKQP